MVTSSLHGEVIVSVGLVSLHVSYIRLDVLIAKHHLSLDTKPQC